MKKIKILIALLFFTGLTAFGQTNSVTGKISDIKPYNDEYSITVNNTFLVLIVDPKDNTRSSFEINHKYKNLFEKKDGVLELNPKYAGKVFQIEYYINGKGWKCIKKIEPSKA